MIWAKIRPDVVGGEGLAEARITRLREVMAISQRHWNRAAGTLGPGKNKALLLDVIIPLLESLDPRVAVDLRDACLFLLSLVCGARAKEVTNLTWKDITVVDGGTAIIVAIRPPKNSTDTSSTHLCQIGRRSHPQV